MNRDGVYYYVRHIPHDLAQHYCVNRLCFSLRTKSLQSANRAAKSVSQRLEDYWLGLRLQRMEIPAMHVLRQDNEVPDDSPILSDACDLYLRLKGSGKDKVFWRTANRNIEYVIKVLGDRPIASYTSAEAAFAYPASILCHPKDTSPCCQSSIWLCLEAGRHKPLQGWPH